MKTKGAYNKPKFGYVKLGDLCKILNEDTKLPIYLPFITLIATANDLEVEIIEKIPTKSSESTKKIEFTVSA